MDKRRKNKKAQQTKVNPSTCFLRPCCLLILTVFLSAGTMKFFSPCRNFSCISQIAISQILVNLRIRYSFLAAKPFLSLSSIF